MRPAREGMAVEAWRASALVLLMADWWMTKALTLTATALLPFLAFPMFGVMSANEAAAAYYSPIFFLVLGGAIIALAIERTGLTLPPAPHPISHHSEEQRVGKEGVRVC